MLFTHEIPSHGTLQFLDLSSVFDKNHVCWQYSQRAQKELLPCDSAHSKLVKRVIATLCLESAIVVSRALTRCRLVLTTNWRGYIKLDTRARS